MATELRLHDDRAREVVDELAAHIADTTDALVGEGLDRERAEREALARLGDARELGRGLRRANRTTRRLLAGATGGAWAATKAGLGGLLIAYGAMVLLVLGLLMLVSLLNRAFSTEISLQSSDRGWNTVFLGGVLWFAAARAATAAVAVASARSLWRASEIRPWVAVAGAAITAVAVGGLWPMSHNWASVLVVGSVPVAAVIGALRATGEPPRRIRGSWSVPAAIAGFALLPAILLIWAGAPAQVSLRMIESPTYASIADMERAHRYDRIASLLPESWRDEAQAAVETGIAGGFATMTARNVTDLPDTTWRDVRLEVWPVGGADTAPSVVTGYEPLAVVKTTRVDGRYAATVRIDRLPTVVFAGLALTGVAPDGERYLLVPPHPQQTAFDGTIADWFAALGR